MSTKLRYQSLNVLIPILILLTIALYFISLWSIGLALSIGISVQVLILAQVIAKAQRSTVRAQDAVFKQYECLKQLYFAVSPNKPLPTTRGYAASPDFLIEIYKKIVSNKPKVIVEGSSGLSTLVSSYAAKQIKNCEVVSLEHDEFYSQISQNHLVEHGLVDHGRVCHAPIISQNINGQTWLWYDFLSADLPQKIDLIIIDGPPKRLQKCSRYPALPLLIDRLSVGGVLMMDDASRDDEVETAKMWAKEFPNVSIDQVPLEKGMAVVTKLRD